MKSDKQTSPVKSFKLIKRTKSDEWIEQEQELIIEEPLQICLDKTPYVTIMRTPGKEKELAVGFCFTEGIINGIGQIRLIEHCGSGAEGNNAINVIDLSLNRPADLPLPKRNIDIRSSCSICGLTTIEELTNKLDKILSSVEIKAGKLYNMLNKMEEQQRLYFKTGTTHAVALFDKSGSLITCAEDTGRHNAFDKIIGHCLIYEINMGDTIAILSGRASFEMVVKAVRARIPIIASVSGTTYLAAQLAQRLGCTLTAYLRGNTMEVYTHAQRVIKD